MGEEKEGIKGKGGSERRGGKGREGKKCCPISIKLSPQLSRPLVVYLRQAPERTRVTWKSLRMLKCGTETTSLPDRCV